jgi:hypothetical protein
MSPPAFLVRNFLLPDAGMDRMVGLPFCYLLNKTSRPFRFYLSLVANNISLSQNAYQAKFNNNSFTS